MSVTAAHLLNSVYIDTTAVAATTIGGIVRQTINTGTQTIKENNSGTLYPEVVYVSGVAPSASFSTTHCWEVINNIGTRALCLDNNGISLYARKQACSGILGAGNHLTYTFTDGLVVPMSMTCDHQGNAFIDVQVLGVSSDGTASASLTTTASSNISTSSTINTARWTLYQAQVAGTSLTHLRNLSVDFGNSPMLESSDQDEAPTFGSVNETAPIITVRGIDPVSWRTYWSGASCTHSNTFFYLKKRGVAVGETEHFKFSINGLVYSQTAFDAAGNATGEVDLIVEGTEDSSGNPPLLIGDNATSALIDIAFS